MKALGIGSALVTLLINSAFAADIATVMGTPAYSLSFTDNIIQERINLVGDTKAEEGSTWVYSILERKGVRSAVSIEVLNSQGSGDTDPYLKGLTIATSKAPVVFSNIGPWSDEACKIFVNHPDVTFVTVAGNQGINLDSLNRDLQNCYSRNILMVNALDQNKGELTDFSNWGSLVRIAAPSVGIIVSGTTGKHQKLTNTTVAASLVAGRLAVFARNNPNMKGSLLVDEFLKANTEQLPALVEKVEGGRALIDHDL